MKSYSQEALSESQQHKRRRKIGKTIKEIRSKPTSVWALAQESLLAQDNNNSWVR